MTLRILARSLVIVCLAGIVAAIYQQYGLDWLPLNAARTNLKDAHSEADLVIDMRSGRRAIAYVRVAVEGAGPRLVRISYEGNGHGGIYFRDAPAINDSAVLVTEDQTVTFHTRKDPEQGYHPLAMKVHVVSDSLVNAESITASRFASAVLAQWNEIPTRPGVWRSHLRIAPENPRKLVLTIPWMLETLGNADPLLPLPMVMTLDATGPTPRHVAVCLDNELSSSGGFVFDGERAKRLNRSMDPSGWVGRMLDVAELAPLGPGRDIDIDIQPETERLKDELSKRPP
ncbi:hypothetical protein ACFQVB_02345 [Paraburkholderia humisilvae]